MKIDRLTPSTAILAELGRRLATVRRQQGLSQEQLAATAGVGIATLRRLEDGKDGKLGSWLRLLVALRMEAAIEGLLPEDLRSPMAEVKRARRRRGPEAASSGGTDANGFRWGDERK